MSKKIQSCIKKSKEGFRKIFKLNTKLHMKQSIKAFSQRLKTLSPD